MADDNITRFNNQVARVFGLLYAAHPNTLDFGANEIVETPPGTDDERREAGGTMTWLHRNGFVDGNLEHFGQVFFQAQLTTRALRFLDTPEGTLGNATLGQVLKRLATDVPSEERKSAVDFLARRIRAA